jgi:hypothetical protein
MVAEKTIMREGDISSDDKNPRFASSFNIFEASYLSLEKKIAATSMLIPCPPGTGNQVP